MLKGGPLNQKATMLQDLLQKKWPPAMNVSKQLRARRAMDVELWHHTNNPESKSLEVDPEDTENILKLRALLEGQQPFTEEWKAEFVEAWNRAEGEDLGVEARREMATIQKDLHGMYTDRHPLVVRDKVDKSDGILIVWYTAKYHESAGSMTQSNPRFESTINSTRDGINNTGWTANGHGELDCEVNCVVTDDLRLAERADVLMFEIGGSIHFPPWPRNPNQIWMAVSYEAAGSAPFFYLSHPGAMSVFNYSSHFAPYADVSTQPLMDASIDKVDVTARSGIVFIASNCNSHSGRDEYTQGLMQHMPVTSYGACLHNQDWPTKVCEITLLKTNVSRVWAHGCPPETGKIRPRIAMKR